MTEGNARRNLDAEICLPFPFGSLGRAAGIALARLRSLSLIEQEYKDFFREFDSVCLSIYPHFIEQANALLQESERLKTATLNTEFRLLAVIRLGITDNAQIAQFLHLSINTVYTYRNRLRNAALGSPAGFEEEIMKIH